MKYLVVFALFAAIGATLAAPAKRSQSTIQYQYQPIQLLDTYLTQDQLLPASHQIVYQDQTLPLVDEYIVEDLPVVDSDLFILGAK